MAAESTVLGAEYDIGHKGVQTLAIDVLYPDIPRLGVSYTDAINRPQAIRKLKLGKVTVSIGVCLIV